MKKYKLIANPASGTHRSRHIAAQVVELLGKRNIAFDLEFTTAPKHAAEIALRSCKDFDAIVAIGGDGPSMRSQAPCSTARFRSASSLRIGQRSRKVPRHPQRRTGGRGHPPGGKDEDHRRGDHQRLCFVNVVGIGFDAAVNHKSHGIRWPASGILRYVAALITTLGTYSPLPLTITIKREHCNAGHLPAHHRNGTTCGGGFRLTPHAKLDDGLLDVTFVKPISVPGCSGTCRRCSGARSNAWSDTLR